MGALSSARGEVQEADNYYRRTTLIAPHNIVARNDFAMHLQTLNRKEDAIKELHKATLIEQNSSLLQKNLGAMHGNRG